MMQSILTSECLKMGFQPRQVQRDAIAWLESKWDSPNKCKILSLPVGAGKSLLAKAVSEFNSLKGLKTAVITPQNLLIDQYIRDFSELNFLKGKTHYDCKNVQDTCEIGLELERVTGEPCQNCPYKNARNNSYDQDITIFNPVSYFLLPKVDVNEKGHEIIYDVDTLIIDEVQSLPALLREMITVKLWVHDIKWKSGISSSIPETVNLLNNYTDKLSKYVKHPNIDRKERARLIQVQRKVDYIAKQLVENSQYFLCEESEEKFRGTMTKCLLVRAKYVPPSIYRNFFKIAKHIVLMSGTTFPYLWEELGFKSVDYIDLPSPIPKNRRLVYSTASIALSSKETDSLKRWDTIQDLASQIKFIVENIHKNENGVILLPYNLAQELKPLLTEEYYIHMDKTTKKKKITEFLTGKTHSVGIFSGSYEGLSLDNKISRFTIIPKVPFPNLMDKVVKARLRENDLSYSLEAMTTIIQASGRSVRSETDYGACYILDSNFTKLYSKTRSYLPVYFKESLVFNFPKEENLKQFNIFRGVCDEDSTIGI